MITPTMKRKALFGRVTDVVGSRQLERYFGQFEITFTRCKAGKGYESGTVAIQLHHDRGSDRFSSIPIHESTSDDDIALVVMAMMEQERER